MTQAHKMKKLLLYCYFSILFSFISCQENASSTSQSYLTIGDNYTIGESISGGREYLEGLQTDTERFQKLKYGYELSKANTFLEEAAITASILGHNYPNSEWYEYSFNLIKKIDEKESFLKKITNIF